MVELGLQLDGRSNLNIHIEYLIYLAAAAFLYQTKISMILASQWEW